MSRSHLRKHLRQLRNQLSSDQQNIAAQKIAKLISQMPWFIQAKKIAVYLANDGELDPKFLVRLAVQMGKEVFVPVLHPCSKGRLIFVRVQPQTPWVKNIYGILEPQLRGYGWLAPNNCITQLLDVIFLPLVGFDATGGRLGMGGGFYDRSLAATASAFKQPRLVGLAHECQKIEHLDLASWDVPLDLVVTPNKVYKFTHSRK